MNVLHAQLAKALRLEELRQQRSFLAFLSRQINK